MAKSSFKSIGIDTCEFEITFKNNQEIEIKELFNEEGIKCAEVRYHYKKWRLIIFLPIFIRENNIIPFQECDFSHLEDIRIKIKEFLYECFGNNVISCNLVSIEVNITSFVAKGCRIHSVINFLNHAFSTPNRQNLIYTSQNKKSPLKIDSDGIICRRSNLWILKCYNKGKKEGVHEDDGLFRLELIFREIHIKNLFKYRTDIDNVLSKKGFKTVFNEYKRIMNKEIDNKTKAYSLKLEDELLNHLMKSNSVKDTFCQYKEIIFDEEILRKVLKRYCSIKGKKDSSRQTLYNLRSNYEIPTGTIETIEKFIELSNM